MRLTPQLLFYVKKKRIPGHIRLGKKQFVPPVYNWMKMQAAEQIVMEQENLDILAKPWLQSNEEQSYNTYLDESGITESLKEAEIHQRRANNMFKHKSMEEFLNHLNTSKKWE